MFLQKLIIRAYDLTEFKAMRAVEKEKFWDCFVGKLLLANWMWEREINILTHCFVNVGRKWMWKDFGFTVCLKIRSWRYLRCESKVVNKFDQNSHQNLAKSRFPFTSKLTMNLKIFRNRPWLRKIFEVKEKLKERKTKSERMKMHSSHVFDKAISWACVIEMKFYFRSFLISWFWCAKIISIKQVNTRDLKKPWHKLAALLSSVAFK